MFVSFINTPVMYTEDSIITPLGIPFVDWLSSNKPADVTIRRLSHQLLSPVEYLHSNNFTHEDLITLNVIIINGNISIIDFGYCRPIKSAEKIQMDLSDASVIIQSLIMGYDVTDEEDEGDLSTLTSIELRKVISDLENVVPTSEVLRNKYFSSYPYVEPSNIYTKGIHRQGIAWI